MVYALLRQLVNKAGVQDEDIPLYDCVFYHGDPVYQYCHADFPGVRRMLDEVSRERYRVEVFRAPSEGRVARITRK